MKFEDQNIPPPAYSEQFFNRIKSGSLRSAEAVVPLILDIIHPESVVDVGCGTGSWLSAFRDLGVTDFLGVDGNRTDVLDIPIANFRHLSLHEAFTLERKFDLALSLEVAEHLPPSRADGFVRDLTSLAPIVLFSAAIPGQTGTNHQNEQWPDYWSLRFASHNYLPMDCLREKIWEDSRVEWWYRQNIIFYAERSFADNRALTLDTRKPRRLVRPEYLEIRRRSSIIRRALRYLIKSIQ